MNPNPHRIPNRPLIKWYRQDTKLTHEAQGVVRAQPRLGTGARRPTSRAIAAVLFTFLEQCPGGGGGGCVTQVELLSDRHAGTGGATQRKTRTGEQEYSAAAAKTCKEEAEYFS